MSETAVKKITGHKSQKEFNKYVNLSKKFLEDVWNLRQTLKKQYIIEGI